MSLTVEAASRNLQEASVRYLRHRLGRPLEERATREVEDIFIRQARYFLDGFAQLQGHFSEGLADEWDPIWQRASGATYAYFVSQMESIAARGLTAGAKSAAATMDVSVAFDLAHPAAVSYMASHAAEAVTGIDETTRAYLNTLLTRGIDEGWSYDTTARAIIDRFAQFSIGNALQHIQSRAHLIAVTENANAYIQGAKAIATEVLSGLPDGLGMNKAWITAGDGAVCEDCAAGEDDGVIAESESFSNGDDEPPDHPGCRCDVAYTVGNA